MEREHTRVHEENKTEAGKVRWVWPDGPDDVGGPAGQRWGRPDEDGDSSIHFSMHYKEDSTLKIQGVPWGP